MKLSDVSVGQLDEQEQEQLNGLGDLAQVKAGSTRTVWRLGDNDATKKLADGRNAKEASNTRGAILLAKQLLTMAKMNPGTMDGEFTPKMAFALRIFYKQYPKALPTNADQKAMMGEAFDANLFGVAEEVKAAAQSAALAPAQGPTAPAPSYGSGYDWAALFKNPWYWAGVAAVVGVAFLYMRSRRSVKAVSAVETLALEGMDEEKPKRKRRRRRKAKKTEE